MSLFNLRDLHINSDKSKGRKDPYLFRSESGVSTPVPLPDVYTQPPHKYPGLDAAQTSTGVIWSTEQATSKGYDAEDPSMLPFKDAG
jgi:hypothetical protein